ncbi:MAG: diguanylate cyclase [Nitrospirota bacterium]
MNMADKPSLFRRIVNIITFKDISIRKKLLLFAAGGLGWYLIIAFIGLGATTYVKLLSTELIDVIIPQVQTGQKVIIKLRGANVSVRNIFIYDDLEVINANLRRTKITLNHANTFLISLLEGGHIRDYSDLTGELIEEFYVVSIKGDMEASENYIKEVLVSIQNLREISDKLTSIKLTALRRGGLSQKERSLIMDKLDEYDALTVESVNLLSKFTSHISTLHKKHTEKINAVLYGSTVTVIVTGLIAVALLIVFSTFLIRSMTQPVKAITEQIKTLSEGEVDLTRKIAITSKDEMGELSANFNRLMGAIHDVNTFKKVIEGDDTLEDVYARLARVFKENLGFNDLLLYEVSNSKNTMRLIHTPSSGEDIYCNREILLDCSLCRAKKTGHTVSSIVYPDICKQFLHGIEKYHICVPMIIGGSTGGVVQFLFEKPYIERCLTTGEITDVSNIEKVRRARQYIKESLPVIEAKRLMTALKESAMRDQLTGLYNRRFLEDYTEVLVAGVHRKGIILGLLMCDLDFFKEVNDRYGHNIGDEVLKETANLIAKSVRTSDLVARFGGEEFLVILEDAKEGDAQNIAERIREKMEETKIKTGGVVIQKTISIGISEFPKDTQNFWEAIKYSDIALYKAKEAGRNKVLRFTKDMWTEEEY